MSRRKQAKPRACHKLGGENPDDDEAEAAADGGELLEPKEEQFSDVESTQDEAQDLASDEREQEDDKMGEDRRVNRNATNAITTSIKTESNDEEALTNHTNNNNNNNNILVNDDDVVAAVTSDATSSQAPQVTNKRLQQDVLAAPLEDGHDDDDDDVDNNYNDVDENEIMGNDDVYNDDLDEEEMEEEDLQSLDSFYSDMYSTHTSSSYSPSISDGTLTPNSLPPHPLHLTGGLHLHAHSAHDEPTLENIAKTNGNATKVTQLEAVAAVGNESETRKRTTQRHNQQQQNPHHTQPHHRNAEHSLKVAHKMRKIDRAGGTTAATVSTGTANKFDKLTGESIKNCRPDGSYQCQFCDKSFPRLGYLKKHEQSHAEHLPFKCDYCARLFKHKRSRDRHTKLHTGDRRYRCPHCEAAFSRSDHLKIHMKTHDNQKPFQCTICNRGYNTAAALTSHMQNHKKQAAILAAGGNPQALNYSPRSTGSASSNGSLHKRRYVMAIASDSSPSRLEYPKRARSNVTAALQLRCTYCQKSDFSTLEQLNGHIQSVHDKEYQQTQQAEAGSLASGFQLSCEYCTMRFASIATLFQHMRSTHIDRLSSPNSYFEHFNRLATTGTFSPRLALAANHMQQHVEHTIKLEQQQSLPSPKVVKSEVLPPPVQPSAQDAEEPTDLSQHNKRRSVSPRTRSASPTPPAPPPPPSASNYSPELLERPGVFFCNQCNAGLPDFESFRNHLKTHIAEGLSLVCHHCGMTLQDHSEYERHVIAHFLISNSEYNCSGNCSKSFAKPDELQKHLIDQHIVTMFKCALCAEVFDTKVAIQVHFACAHTTETKLLRCSACMEVFRAETDFQLHVKTRHQLTNNMNNNSSSQGAIGALGLNSLQCMFCRAVCASDLEMHFHLAAHARQFRCPSCPETFHVEFLLDRHMQSHHGGNERANERTDKESYEEQSSTLSPMNSLYVNALFGGKPPLLPPLAANQTNNNNSIIDYNVAFAAAHLQKGLFPPPAAAASKFYSPLQVDTASAMKQHPALMYGLSQRYFDTNRALMDMYAAQQEKTYFVSPKPQQPTCADSRGGNGELNNGVNSSLPGFSCGMCERNDFRTEAEVHSHRKIVHNMKTGVSLRCAYCCGNFKSRSELEHHMKTCHNSTGKHKCLICDEVFPSPAILAEHKLQHSKVGQSGKCSHCSKPLADVAAFKDHLGDHNNNNEGQMPVQCICCRQTLHSDFEISLHAKFHTKSGSTMQEAACALCLEPIGHGAVGSNGNNSSESTAKVCEKCCRKHNLNTRSQRKRSTDLYGERSTNDHLHHHHHVVQYIENRCNLCKMILPHAQKLQEHLVEHTFAGTEERGFNCYICSAVFTAPSGLLNHMNEHGANARPYDCNLCPDKFYFRAELDHHLREHELRPIPTPPRPTPKEERATSSPPLLQASPTVGSLTTPPVKQEMYESETQDENDSTEHQQEHNTSNAVGEDDEYIEVEQVPESRLDDAGRRSVCSS